MTRVLDGTGAVIEPYGGVAIGNVSDASLPRCPKVGPCEADYTLVAVLADPGAGPVTLTWTAQAGSRFPEDKAPPDATLTIAADEPLPVAADTMRFASAEAGSLSLGAAQPYVERSFTVTMPATEPSRALVSGLVLVAATGANRKSYTCRRCRWASPRAERQSSRRQARPPSPSPSCR